MPDLYEKACRKVNARIGPDGDEIKKRRIKKKDEFLDKRKEFRRSEDQLKEEEIIHGQDSKEYKKRKKDHDKKKEELEKVEEKYKKESFKRTMKFIDMDFKYEEILTFSIFTASLTFIFSLISVVGLLTFLDFPLFQIVIFGVPILTIFPAIAMFITAYYPELVEKRMKADCIGEIPETINFMTMSMRINPSLHRAVVFAAENTKEPISSGLKKISWDVYMREQESLEESFLDFAMEWGEWNENLKRSLYAIRSSMLEKTDEGFRTALMRANDIVIEGTKQEVEDFTNSLQTPTTILFAIGVLLPLIVGAMLPMAALGGLDITGMTDGGTDYTSPVTLPLVVFLMNVVFPLAAFLYSYHIIGKRPGMKRPVDVQKNEKKSFHILISITILVGIGLVISLFYALLRSFMPLPFFFLIIVPISYYCLATSHKEKEERERISKMEEQFPDALFQLGSRIAEGTSLEKALVTTSKSLKDTEVSELFDDISSSLKITRLSIEETLFGDKGILLDHPSKTIKTAMKTVIKISEKDPEEAGKTIMKVANYKQDLQEMDNELKNMLSKSVEMMKGTNLIFAPVTMGIISSLYFMLEDVFTNLGGVDLISPVAFSAVIGVYLILMGIVITYFTKGIENSLDAVEFKYSFGKTILISITVYSISLIFGKMMILNM
ncbi:MAG: hypothetical protein V5A66_01390 [Candidatus Thermoplasmatota archaeon]